MSFEIFRRNANFLAQQVGCDILDYLNDENQLECLQNVPADDILAGVYFGFTVNVDGEFAPFDAVVPVTCEETVLNGNYDANIELLIGANTEEGLLMTYPAYLDPRLVMCPLE